MIFLPSSVFHGPASDSEQPPLGHSHWPPSVLGRFCGGICVPSSGEQSDANQSPHHFEISSLPNFEQEPFPAMRLSRLARTCIMSSFSYPDPRILIFSTVTGSSHPLMTDQTVVKMYGALMM